MIVEYCNGGSLEDILYKNDGILVELTMLKIIWEIAQGF